jgi:DNA topoisomerase IA
MRKPERASGMNALVVAEKPSVARSIRLTIKPPPQTLALRGHFLELDFPEAFSKWRDVNPEKLFEAPVTWVVRDRKAHRDLVRNVENADLIVLATDNDAEGELIAYEVLLAAEKTLGSRPKFKRMRFNAATPEELRNAWNRLEPDLNWRWVWKALFRHRFDLATGAAYTRLLTLSGRLNADRRLVSWGSCQAPTLWFVYEREVAIRNFKPENYWVISAVVDAKGVKAKVSTAPLRDEALARQLYTIASAAEQANVAAFKLEDEVARKPLPTDTDAMLQELSRILGISAVKVMAVAERLYGDGAISYPRTETNMWVGVDHKRVLAVLAKTPLASFVNYGNFNPRSGKRNDEAHPPIHPTSHFTGGGVEGKVWEYVARRYLANVVGRDAQLKKWRLGVELNGIPMEASNKYFVDRGFYAVFPYFEPRDTLQIPQLRAGEALPVLEVKLDEKQTKPPQRLTEAELLKLLKKHGIGTDATRADYPHLIVERGYAWKKGKAFYLTDLGEKLMNLLKDADARLVTPETRRYVEELMTEIERGRRNVDDALKESLSVYQDLYRAVANKLGYLFKV